MKGNQGLEALAALCGGQSDAPTEGNSGSGGAQALEAVGGAGVSSSSSKPSQQPMTIQEALSQASHRQSPMSAQQSSLANLNQQQWQQALAAASALQGGGMGSSLGAQSLLLSGLSSQGLGDSTFSAMQQLALQQYVQAQAKLSAAQQAAAVQSLGFGDANQALMLALAAGKANQLQPNREVANAPSLSQQQVIPAAVAASTSSTVSLGTSSEETSSKTSSNTNTAQSVSTAHSVSPSVTSMKPPPPPSSQTAQKVSTSLSTSGLINQGKSHQKIAPMPGGKILPSSDSISSNMSVDDKKQQKRAANRRSAQLSRKRKKQFIEELKEENDELRRKEQILRSIPDLIVVFDSSGKLGFVSQSVSRFLEIPAEDLEGSSFWDRLCEDSVRLLKAAFMDSLAARQADSDTAPLGSGVWELRLVDKNSNYIIVTLNGVVHFSGEAPECVCCIRPRDEQPIQKLPAGRKTKAAKTTARTVSSSDGSRSSDESNKEESHPRIRVKPSQSVISNDNSTEDNSAEDNSAEDNSAADDSSPPEDDDDPARKKARMAQNVRRSNGIIRISDADSGCEVSSSGSDDGIASN